MSAQREKPSTAPRITQTLPMGTDTELYREPDGLGMGLRVWGCITHALSTFHIYTVGFCLTSIPIPSNILKWSPVAKPKYKAYFLRHWEHGGLGSDQMCPKQDFRTRV